MYQKYIFPKLLNFAMKAPALTKIRSSLLPIAEGKVLEIGIGSGLNLPFYNSDAQITGVDPSTELQAYAQDIAIEQGLKVEFLAQSGESIPVDNNSFDSVVMTWSICSIPEPNKVLLEIRRVLKPQGKVIFAEHGIAPDQEVVKWQNRINPIWNVIGGGCNLNREIDRLYIDAGFAFSDIEKGYIPGPRWATYNYQGVATIA